MSDSDTTRRRFLATLGLTGGAVVLTSLSATSEAAAGATNSAAGQPATGPTTPVAGTDTTPVYLGSFSWTDPPGRGLDVGSRDTDGTITATDTVAGVPDASFLAFSPDRRFLYAVNELSPTGTVTALSLTDPWLPSPINTASTQGSAPTHLVVHPDGRFLIAANYGSGSVVVHPLAEDGSVGAATDLVQHVGDSRDPHAHQVVIDPLDSRVIAVDLGADSVYVYSLDTASGTLRLDQQLRLASGSGPRHLAFHPDGRHAYVLAELDSTITVLAWDPTTGFTTGATISSRAAGATGENFPAEIAVSADGRFVYASNRGDDDIAVFAVAEDGASLTLLGTESTGGAWPRHFAIGPDGNHLYVANQNSGAISRLPRDPESGLLSPVDATTEVPGVCVVAFLD
ncbi:lactonase family protein [Actinoalloteichus hymeniacidonis]|uniref:3-carboxymuconate cyclase n=1 Tax=Actinoalloteichus hymeniacidonis TaxID=340345 RepID=A0AAC9HR96_9PSEU|nr:lactonase family protein [Actinoalloteichus hymeniacidonis]AOS64182.1 3-carboxymuconate cyclase [Actinoalloteichus hymeniacidonis]MBB5907750.1 6-phosphogluconolactonase (cycloisomerase 2 family) [Actinoalloteichus hymeniacidonis]